MLKSSTRDNSNHLSFQRSFLKHSQDDSSWFPFPKCTVITSYWFDSFNFILPMRVLMQKLRFVPEAIFQNIPSLFHKLSILPSKFVLCKVSISFKEARMVFNTCWYFWKTFWFTEVQISEECIFEEVHLIKLL